VPPESLKQHYQSKADDELLALVVDADSLTEEARPILAEELRRRNLVEQPLPEIQSPTSPSAYWYKVYSGIVVWVQSWLLNNPFDMEVSVEEQEEKNSWLRGIVSFVLHTIVVYIFALQISPMLVGRWFAWIVPLLDIPTTTSSRNWYLQHLEVTTIVPAMAAGYTSFARFLPATFGRRVGSRRSNSADTWAWVIPALVLFYKMLHYRGHSSVMASMSVIEYFFDTPDLRFMQSNLPGDPVRIWAQVSISAPFCAGVAYSFAALAGKRNLLSELFTFESSEERPIEKL
jgi:hypothetical protein